MSSRLLCIDSNFGMVEVSYLIHNICVTTYINNCMHVADIFKVFLSCKKPIHLICIHAAISSKSLM